ncbi:hypothetical protein N7474_008599 [Penicillium riverlandense]|uniref:uncharacterized protein n=1 Tax=Penicillium riverlandense TaxID=1903569 RepID=UPI002546DCFB|nr:uncharacterized protein N7474_008599 [Penicillium riverlandense]KAJ5812298.1 hypothetical protein N7474_008599 [Penicillium riverlandense]
MSFRLDYSDSDESDADKASPKHYDGVSRSSKPSVCSPVRSRNLLDFSDDPDNDTNEDITNIPLNYRRSEKTKVRGKDPHGGPPILLVEIRLEHTKRFLGSKAINTFIFPKIIDDPSLIFSPHIFIFSILF